MFSFLPACIKNVEKWCWSGKVGDTQIRPGNGQKRGMQQQTGIVIMPVWPCITLSSVQFSRWVMSDSLWPHELEHTRPPCPSPTPGVHLNSRPSSRWCHPAISSSVVPFSSCPQSLPASESFPMSQLLHEVAKVLELLLPNTSFVSEAGLYLYLPPTLPVF